jgi:RNA polymerase sigma factor (sigma-70 family)
MSLRWSAPPPALEAFCHASYPRLVGAMTLYCGDRGVAEEIAQEALIRVCRNWGRVARLDNPGAWANRVAVNLANSHFRRKSLERRARIRLSAGHDDGSAGDLEGVELRRLVAGLPRRERTAVVLRHYVGMSVAETADFMGCAEGTVKRLTHQAIASLRDQTAHDDGPREATNVSRY